MSAVIPTLGRSAHLERVLAALGDAERIVVLDPAGSPCAQATVRAGRPGASAARNAGIAAATSPVVLFLGDDVVPAPDLVARHTAFHAAHPDEHVALLGHVTLVGNGSAFERWLEHGIQSNYASIAGDRAGWGHFLTTNVSVKKAFLERAGGFDEELPFLYEDLDLGKRLAELGMDLRYDPAARAEHRHPATLEEWQQRMRAIGRAERAFVTKHPDVAPYFHERLRRAAEQPPARGRAATLIRWVGPGTPLIGRRAWGSAEAAFGQALWPSFEAGWNG